MLSAGSFLTEVSLSHKPVKYRTVFIFKDTSEFQNQVLIDWHIIQNEMLED